MALDLSNNIIEAIAAWAESTMSVEQIILIGDRAQWGAHPQSNLDLAVRLRGPAGAQAFESHSAEWETLLGKITGLRVNLSALSEHSAGLRAMIEDHGVTLFDRRF
jgi:pyruvate/2-oxoglutarate/acetoin dehydrogenase E1 component